MDAVLTHNAHAVLLCHNHPSGSVAPSMPQDLDATRVLSGLLSEVEVVLIDHIIVSDQNRRSAWCATGLIRQTSTPEGIEVKIAEMSGEKPDRKKLKIDHQSETEELL